MNGLLLAAASAAAEPPGSTEGGIPFALLFLLLLVSCNAFFAASEIAIISLNDTKLRRMAEQGHPKAKLLTRFLDEPGRFLATIQVGITLAGFLASAFAADSFGERIAAWFTRQPWCTLSSAAIQPAAVVGITMILSFMTLVFGELVPKRVAMRHSEAVALRAARTLTLVSRFMRPFVWLLNASTNRIVRLFGIDPLDNAKSVSEEEIRMMVDLGREKGVIAAAEKEMIENVFEFNNKSASDIMVHRRDIVALPIDVAPEDCRRVLRECGFSRLPVYSGTIDDVVGVLNVRDYFIKSMDDDDPALGPLLRQPVFVPETIRADVLFRDMQRRKQSLAIVLDEYGGTAGLVSLEDLLEEIVGDIYDEYDEEEQQGEWEKIDDNTYRVRGATSLSDVSELLAVDLPEDDYHTLGGMIFGRLSVIPSVGTILKLPEFGLLMTVEKMDGRRVASVLVRRVRPRDKTTE
jgi:putative hemolysin